MRHLQLETTGPPVPSWRSRGRVGARSSMAKLSVVVLVSTMFGVLLTDHGAAGAQAVEGGGAVTWGVAPAGADGPDGRTAFVYSLDPGEVVDDFVAVSNFSEEPIDLDVYGNDAFNTPEGAFDLLPADQEPVDLGSWLQVAQEEITVPARSRVIVPFRMTLPALATPGDHAGGIVASVVTPSGEGVGVAVDRRVGARIYVRVSGDLRPVLEVDDLQARYHGSLNPLGGRTTMTYTVRNTGNVTLTGQPDISAAGPFGLLRRHGEAAALPELLPGQSFTTRQEIGGVPALVRVVGRVEIEPAGTAGQLIEPRPPTVIAGAGSWALPWTVLWVLIVVAVTAGIRVVQLRRSAEPMTTPPTDGVPVPVPASFVPAQEQER